MLSSNIKQINALYSKLDDKSEFEVMFNNYNTTNKQSMNKFINVLNYVKWRSHNEKLKLVNETCLDITYYPENNTAYRISISGIDRINNILNLVHQRQNHIICSILATQFYNAEGLTFIKKKIDRKNIIDIDQYDIRFRLSSEDAINKKDLDILSNIQYNERDNISYRYKQRVSLFVSEKNNIKIDLSDVKFSNNPNQVALVNSDFEIEIDYSPGADSKASESILQIILDETTRIKQVLENTDELIPKEHMNEVLLNYKKIIYGYENNTSTTLYSMKPISAEVQHIVDKIPNKYSVTDKADGDHYMLFVLNNALYLISNNLVIRKTKYTVKNIGNCIFEGELIYLTEHRKYIFMIFDCLYYDGKDYRNENILQNRLKFIQEFTKLMNIDNYNIKDYDGVFDLVKQEEYYVNAINKYYTIMNKTLDALEMNSILFYQKIFLIPTGGDNSEVYSLAYTLWDQCTNSLSKCRYKLDGIIFTSLNQKYTQDKKDQKYPIYKYKPPTTNSIDVYITFPKNIETNTYIDFYDNTLSAGNVFRIINFFVGDSIGGVGSVEVPVPFMKEENNHEAFFPVDKNHVRDIEGNLVNDNTVVEVVYINDILVPHQYRWKILRTRWDKTESVIRNQKSYGNFKDIAIKVWKSIRESITIDEIKKLSRAETYATQQKQLASRIDTKIISSERAQDIYYQKITNLGKVFREFHNWVKSNMIYTYCGQYLSDNKMKKKTVLDIGFGRGGDLMKYYHPKVSECVAIDTSYEDLFGAIDSASVRYQTYKTKFPFFTNFTLIQADARMPLVSTMQEKQLRNMTPENKKLIDTVFNNKRQFDVISIQFAIHYFYDTQLSIDNFTNTIKTYLKKDGYLMCTLFDPHQVMILLNNKDSFSTHYTTDDGQRSKFFEITKKFQGDVQDIAGQMIDVQMGWISETPFTEYLITPKLLISSMKKAGCSLVETDLFVNTYNINTDWMLNVAKHEHNPKNKQFYDKVAQFYGDLKGADKEGKIWNKLFRFYIFKKL